MHIANEIRKWSGVVPSRALIEAGFSYRALNRMCLSGELHRVRQGWLAAPGADAELLIAAQSGGVLTCVTQAKRLGLWVTHVGPQTHIGLSAGARTPRDDSLCLHWNAPIMQRDRRQLEDNLVNVLATVALCQPTEDAHAIWESALRAGQIELAELRRLPFTGRAKALVKDVFPHLDSGLESLVLRRMRRFRIRIKPQSWVLGHYVDFLIGDRLILQIDGGTHVGPQRASDIAHDAQLLLNGYHVIRVGYDQVVHHWPEVQDLILRAIAQGLADAS
ncbi:MULTISPECIES: DUF559 domain-containing protein [unclassified Leucobacter]|uniref:DUF559 domain-containing protein n=1 Tax=unclassified Leucobacter TaxID=2621730 RepID=UPI001F1316AE|nr:MULTISPECIES: DUF559 domain-containing protein [unclassified Leucobacter]